MSAPDPNTPATGRIARAVPRHSGRRLLDALRRDLNKGRVESTLTWLWELPAQARTPEPPKRVEQVFEIVADALTAKSALRTELIWLNNPGARAMLDALLILPRYERHVVIDTDGCAHWWAEAPDDQGATRFEFAPTGAGDAVGRTLCGQPIKSDLFSRAPAGTWAEDENNCSECASAVSQTVDRPRYNRPLSGPMTQRWHSRAPRLAVHALRAVLTDDYRPGVQDLWKLGSLASETTLVAVLVEHALAEPRRTIARLDVDGSWPARRAELAAQTGIPEDRVEELIPARAWFELMRAAPFVADERALWAKAKVLLRPRRRARKARQAGLWPAIQSAVRRDYLARIEQRRRQIERQAPFLREMLERLAE